MAPARQIMFSNWGLLEPEFVCGAKTGRLAFYEAHAEKLDNLTNDNYWKQFMTDIHHEMKRHPNRSADWVPQEILEQRDVLLSLWCEYLLEPGTYATEDLDPYIWREGVVCSSCGIDRQQVATKLEAFNNHNSWQSPSLYIGWCNFCAEEKLAKITALTAAIKSQF